jgi:hypothetical protein
MRAKKTLFFIVVVSGLGGGISFAQLDGTPGAFTRMGFGARGMGMANAMTAVTAGEVSSFYNPAVTPFLETRVASISYGFLSLDRALNTLSYSQSIAPTAGFSIGVLNAGVKDIDGRDADGFQTGTYSTSENQFSFSFANKMSSRVALGIGIKLYYYSLFEGISSTTVGLDFGALVKLSDNFTLGAAVIDVGSKYQWNTSSLYGEQGNSTTEHFPQLRKVGVAYAPSNGLGVLSVEIENSNVHTNIIRGGAEINITKEVTARIGLDNFDVKNNAEAAPTFGFTVRTQFESWSPAVNYAYVIEPYNLFGIHVISLSTQF